eukprot:g70107.t1
MDDDGRVAAHHIFVTGRPVHRVVHQKSYAAEEEDDHHRSRRAFQEPTLAVAPATEPPQDDKHEDKQAQAEGKVGNASSPLSAFGKKKNKSQTKPKEHENKVYVIFNSDMDQPDAIYEEKKEGSKEAVFMITGGDDEIPFVAYEGAGVIRVFRSFKALKAYYIKGLELNIRQSWGYPFFRNFP